MLVSSEECQLPLIAIVHLLFKFSRNKEKNKNKKNNHKRLLLYEFRLNTDILRLGAYWL